MKERPILMSHENVKAILEDRKTQTRRVIKNPFGTCWDCWQKSVPHNGKSSIFVSIDTNEPIPYLKAMYCEHNDTAGGRISCPYGQVGDRLWVRETHYRYGKWLKNGFTKTGRQKWAFKAMIDSIGYIGNPLIKVKPNTYRKEAWYKRPSIFMPRWASRINLEITEIRVERVQEITEEDAKAEGIIETQCNCGECTDSTYAGTFQYLWESLNAKRGYSWESNPWVWVVTCKKV